MATGETIILGDAGSGESDGAKWVSAEFATPVATGPDAYGNGDAAERSNSESGGTGIIDPATGTAAPYGYFANGKPRKRRPNGQRGTGVVGNTGSGSRDRTPSQTTSDLATIIGGLHFLLAAATKSEELEIDDDEAKVLAAATRKLTDLYDVPLPSEKVIAWGGLLLAMHKVYTPRIVAIKLKKMGDKDAKKGQGQTIPFPSPQAQAPAPPSKSAVPPTQPDRVDLGTILHAVNGAASGGLIDLE